MGIVHFAGLGRSPGAVTSGLAYVNREYAARPEYGDPVESLVEFTSPEVAGGSETAYESDHNEYMSLQTRQTWARGKKHAPEIVTEFFEREIGQGTLYLCQVDVNDFSACFEAVAKALLTFHRPGDVGKHIWANITGGTNPLNAALFQAAYLSGFIARLYYTFVSDVRQCGKYLQPFSNDPRMFDFREIYVLKAAFDDRFQHVLEELEAAAREEPERWLAGRELLGRLKSKGVPGFGEMQAEAFRLNFLHVMQGRGVQRRGKDDAVRLDPLTGPALLRILRSDVVQALLWREQVADDEVKRLTSDLAITERWSRKG